MSLHAPPRVRRARAIAALTVEVETTELAERVIGIGVGGFGLARGRRQQS